MCEKVIDYYDTANNPVYKIKCNCGTTACQKTNALYSNIKTRERVGDEFTQEEEKLFYEKAFSTNL